MPNMVPDGSMSLNADAMLASGETLSSEALYLATSGRGVRYSKS